VKSRLDPELRGPLDIWHEVTNGGINLNDIPQARRTMDALAQAQASKAVDIEGVDTTDHMVPGAHGDPDVHVRRYTPVGLATPLPALLWIHGGGFVLGSVERDDLVAKHLSKTTGSVVVSVDYRLAPEHPFPAPLEDCYTALKWLAQNSDEFGVDSKRIAIGGASAGGGLAAGLALLARDRAQLRVCFQLLIYPMLDDRNIAPVSASTPDTFVWSRENNVMGWKAYLGDTFGTDAVSYYAAPSRAVDLVRLPPAYISVGDLDLFLDENITYAQRLISAGVGTQLHVYPGAFHGFNGFVPGAAISRRFNGERDAVLTRALHG
jgi:acetyl esterase/lipase